MPSVEALLAALRRQPPAPGAPLCRACGVREATVGEDEPLVCRPCLMRLSTIAAHPDRFSSDELAALWSAHEDVVRIGQVVLDEHMVVAWPFVRRCQHIGIGWIWTDTWPGADVRQAHPST